MKMCIKIYVNLSFRDGTTDVTRTFHFGEPTAFQKVTIQITYPYRRGQIYL